MESVQRATGSPATWMGIASYEEKGLARIGKIDEWLLDSLRVEADRLLSRPRQSRDRMLQFFTKKPYEHLVWTNPEGATIHYDLPGASPLLDAALAEILTQQCVKETLLATMGSGYRLWWSQFRRAHEGSRGLRMHQDLPGQTTLSILLEDAPDANGTTVLIPGSFRWAPVINSFPVLQPEHFGERGCGLTGAAGSMYLFSPTTWHGRAARPRRDQTVLMMSFLPRDSRAMHRTPPESTFNRLPAALQDVFRSDSSQPETRPMTSDLEKLLTADFPVSLVSPWRFLMGPAWGVRRALRIKRKVAAFLAAQREARRIPRSVIPGVT